MINEKAAQTEDLIVADTLISTELLKEALSSQGSKGSDNRHGSSETVRLLQSFKATNGSSDKAAMPESKD